MEDLRKTQQKYCSRALTSAIIIALVMIIVGYKPIAKGLILGTLFSVINFIVMGESIQLRLGHSTKKTFGLSLFWIFARYILMAIPLIIGIKVESVNFFATVAGLFFVQCTILLDVTFIKRGFKNGRLR